MGSNNWIASRARLIIGVIAAVVIAASGSVFELLSGIDIGFVKFLLPAVGVLAFFAIAIRRPGGR